VHAGLERGEHGLVVIAGREDEHYVEPFPQQVVELAVTPPDGVHLSDRIHRAGVYVAQRDDFESVVDLPQGRQVRNLRYRAAA
jgi:hypothetical protein